MRSGLMLSEFCSSNYINGKTRILQQNRFNNLLSEDTTTFIIIDDTPMITRIILLLSFAFTKLDTSNLATNRFW